VSSGERRLGLPWEGEGEEAKGKLPCGDLTGDIWAVLGLVAKVKAGLGAAAGGGQGSGG
jgi:hypothetical protein